MAGLPRQCPPGLLLLFPLLLLPLLKADPYPFEWHSSDFSCSGLIGGKWESAASLCVLVSEEATAWKDAPGVCRKYSFSQPLSDTSWTQQRKIGLQDVKGGPYWTNLNSNTNKTLMDGAVEMSMYSPAWADREPTTTTPGLCVAIDLSPLDSSSRGWTFVNCSTALNVVCQTFACLGDEWRCVDNSRCIPSSHRRDGVEDCLDGSDEFPAGAESLSVSSDISLLHCPLPKDLRNVEVKKVSGYEGGDIINWQCSRGFFPSDEIWSTCTPPIGWLPSIGCIPLNCSVPYWFNFNLTNPNNGTSQGSRAFFSRSLPFKDPDNEYKLIQVCDEGKWTKLNTELTDCFAPPNEAFTRFNASTVSQFEQMPFRCPRSLRPDTWLAPICQPNGMLAHVPNCTIESTRFCTPQRTPPFNYSFCSCPPGYVTDADGTNCIRTDACALGTHTCAVGSTCQDLGDGTYKCICPKGQCLYPFECKKKGLLAFVHDGQYDPSIGVCADIRCPPYSSSPSEDFICNASAASTDYDSLHSYYGSLDVYCEVLASSSFFVHSMQCINGAWDFVFTEDSCYSTNSLVDISPLTARPYAKSTVNCKGDQNAFVDLLCLPSGKWAGDPPSCDCHSGQQGLPSAVNDIHCACSTSGDVSNDCSSPCLHGSQMDGDGSCHCLSPLYGSKCQFTPCINPASFPSSTSMDLAFIFDLSYGGWDLIEPVRSMLSSLFRDLVFSDANIVQNIHGVVATGDGAIYNSTSLSSYSTLVGWLGQVTSSPSSASCDVDICSALSGLLVSPRSIVYLFLGGTPVADKCPSLLDSIEDSFFDSHISLHIVHNAKSTKCQPNNITAWLQVLARQTNGVYVVLGPDQMSDFVESIGSLYNSYAITPSDVELEGGILQHSMSFWVDEGTRFISVLVDVAVEVSITDPEGNVTLPVEEADDNVHLYNFYQKCPKDWDPLWQHCVFSLSDQYTNKMARKKCNDMNSFLIDDLNDIDHKRITDRLSGKTSWLSLEREDNVWYFHYTDSFKSPILTQRWSSKADLSPASGKNCSYMDTDGKWMTDFCHSQHYSMCMKIRGNREEKETFLPGLYTLLINSTSGVHPRVRLRALPLHRRFFSFANSSHSDVSSSIESGKTWLKASSTLESSMRVVQTDVIYDETSLTTRYKTRAYDLYSTESSSCSYRAESPPLLCDDQALYSILELHPLCSSLDDQCQYSVSSISVHCKRRFRSSSSTFFSQSLSSQQLFKMNVDVSNCARLGCMRENTENCYYEDKTIKCECKKGYCGEFCEQDAEKNVTCKRGLPTTRLNAGNSLTLTSGCVCDSYQCPVTRGGDPCNGKCPPERGTCEYSPVANAYGCKCKERLPFSLPPFDTSTSTTSEYVSPFTWNFESPSSPIFSTSTSSRPTSSIYPSTRPSPSPSTGGGEVEPSLPAPSSISTAFVGEWCDREWTPCMESPCSNGGTCLPVDSSSYICECPTGWTDASCLTPQSICASSPCQNGGSCVDIIPGVFFCSCPPKWTGEYCEILYSSTMPCYNDGEKLSDGSCVCIPPSVWDGSRCTVLQWSIPATECGCASDLDTCVYGDTMSCLCREGYAGQQCQQEVQYCIHSPCLHEGTCTEKPSPGVGYTCQCPQGYTGQACESPIDCHLLPCLNGGTCLPNGICNCTLQYTGEYCAFPINNHCPEGFCKHGGTCVPDSLGHPTCLCDDVEWTGPTCEKRVKATRNIVLTRTDQSVGIPLVPSFNSSSPYSLCGFVRLQPLPATSGRPIPIVSITYPGGEFLRVTSKEVLVGGESIGALPFIPFHWQHFCITRHSPSSYDVYLNDMKQPTSSAKSVSFSSASLSLSPVPSSSEDAFEGTISHLELYSTAFFFYDVRKMYTDCGLWSQRPPDDVLVSWATLVDSSPREALVSPGFCESTHCPPAGEECRTEDRTPPVAYFCPSKVHVVTADNVHFSEAKWDEPIFVDDYDIVSVTSNYQNGEVFAWGDYLVIYTARDGAGNTGRCSFDVFVAANNCTMPLDPEYGKRVNLTHGDNEVGAGIAVAVQCNDPKFPLLGPSFHTCDYLGQWGRVFYTPYMTLPQCAHTTTPMQNISGTVGFADASDCKKKRAEIVAAIDKSIADFCPDGNYDCADIRVTTCNHSAVTWRSRANGALNLEFFVSLNSSMDNIASSLNASLHHVSPQVVTNPPFFDCTAAFPHKSSKDGETVCAQTAKGTFYNVASNAAEPCPPDTYQDDYSKTNCTKCEDGYTTGGLPGRTSVNDCFRNCDPGYACNPRVNRKLCVICAQGSYAEDKGTELCTPCKLGYTTSGEGSTNQTDCNVMACKAGFQEDSHSKCVPCDRGTYKTDKEPMCKECTRGLSTVSDESKSPSDCSILYCPKNTAINPSSPVTGLDPNTFNIDDHCTPCAIEYFQPQPNSTECILCLNSPAPARDPDQCPPHSDECDAENPCGPGKECVLSAVTGHRVCKESSDSSSSPFPWWAGTIIGVAVLAALIGLAVMLWIYREKLSCCSYWKKPDPPSPEDFTHSSSEPMSSPIVEDVDYDRGDSDPKGGNYLSPLPTPSLYPNLHVDVHQREDYGRSGQAFQLAPAPPIFPAKVAEVLPHELVAQYEGNPSVLPPSAHSLRSAYVASEVPGSSYGAGYDAVPSPPQSTNGSRDTSRDNTPRNSFRHGRSTRLNEGQRPPRLTQGLYIPAGTSHPYSPQLRYREVDRGGEGRERGQTQRSRSEGGYNFPDEHEMHH